MAAVPPYQPSLLRLLHGAVALLLPMAWLSGLIVYANHDGRWGRLPWRLSGDWIDIHGTVGVLLWPLALLFVVYACSLGRSRLARVANAAPLLALTLAVGSGKLMNEDWLRNGQLDSPVYRVHVLAWLALAVVVPLHLLGGLRRGGPALLSSMVRLRTQARDQPRHWPGQIHAFFRAKGNNSR
jgi:hypothetical protein